MSENKVLLISPPYMQISIPPYEIPLSLKTGCKYMNPSLLISSTIFDEHNISNKIIKISDVNNLSPIKTNVSNCIMACISVTSAWEYLESLHIAKEIKKINPNIKVILGGWQIKSIKKDVFNDSEDIDYIILGDVEYTIYELYNRISNKTDEEIPSVFSRGETENINNIVYPNVDFKVINFSKYPDYKSYLPYVEESRNCPYKCNFCLNSCVVDKYQNVPNNVFFSNVKKMKEAYGESVEASLLAANFGVDKIQTSKKLEYLESENIKWNIEFHVDNKWEHYIKKLKKSGVCKASIGVESCSPEILKLMNKTSNPREYLIRLNNLLKELNNQDISPSLNILFYYWDRIDTIEETLEYLNNHKSMFKKAKANFMFAFQGLNKLQNIPKMNDIEREYSKKVHVFPNLPKEFSIEEISYLINEVENGNYKVKIKKY